MHALRHIRQLIFIRHGEKVIPSFLHLMAITVMMYRLVMTRWRAQIGIHEGYS
jgi:hypothetical protein